MADPDALTDNLGSGSDLDMPTASFGGQPAERPWLRPAAIPPEYVVERELGRGGVGVVYLAHQPGLKRPVALKFLHAAGDAAKIIRFLAEAEAVAAVRHPNVAEVYHYGEQGGDPYLVLEYIPGGTLFDRLQAGPPLAPREAAELLRDTARGVQAAHALGIVHRDLKPHNILLTADGSPKVSDFGLAKLVGPTDLTRTRTVMGTPAYMPPEQANGDAKFVGPQADVWALGVVLYELLTGVRPFHGDDSWALLSAVIRGDFQAPRKLKPALPRDLELICLKCLCHDAAGRYPTAGALADDLDNWLAGRPIRARRAGVGERAWKSARRNKAAATALLAVMATLTAATLLSLWLAGRAIRAEADTAAQLGRTRQAEADAVTRGKEATDALAHSEKMSKLREEALAVARRRAVLSYVAYAQLCSTASRLADADATLGRVAKPRSGATQVPRFLAADFLRHNAEWVAGHADPAVKAKAADLAAALVGWQWPNGEPPPALHKKAIALDRACKVWWNNTVEREAPDLAATIRANLYKRACGAADVLLKGGDAAAVEAARREFWELYWGELAIVESLPVEEAMVAVGHVLDAWPAGKPAPAKLAAAVAHLRAECAK